MLDTLFLFCFLKSQPVEGVEEKRSAGQTYPFQFKSNMLPAFPSTTRAPIFYKRNTPLAMTEAQSRPLGVPAFKPLKTATNIQSMLKKPNELGAATTPIRNGALHQYAGPNLSAANLTFIQTQLMQQNPSMNRPNPMVISPQANAFKVPAFQALPASVSRIPNGQIIRADNDNRKLAGVNAIDSENYSTIQRVDVS